MLAPRLSFRKVLVVMSREGAKEQCNSRDTEYQRLGIRVLVISDFFPFYLNFSKMASVSF